MPSSSAGARLNGRSSTNTHWLGCHAGALGAQLVHPRGGLADALLAGDDDAVEQLGEEVVRVAVHSPGVGHQRRADAGRMRGAHRLDHRRRRAPRPRTGRRSARRVDPSSAANCGSNSRSSSAPFSKATSSSRASGSRTEAAQQRRGSISAATQKASKEANRLVVSTPPQSISRPAGGVSPPRVRRLGGASAPRPAARRCRCHSPPAPAWRQLEHALAELLQVGVVGGAGDGALVVALHEHRSLFHSASVDVPAQVAHRAPGALFVAGDQLRAGGEALGPRDRAQRARAARPSGSPASVQNMHR